MKKPFNTLLIIFTLAFIWGNSLLDSQSSSEASTFVREIVEPVLEIALGKGNVTEHFVRKLAHFTEFFALGAELLPAFNCRFVKRNSTLCLNAYALSITHSLFAALADETIQIFTSRGSSVADVWLDLSGAACGAGLAFLVITFVTNKGSGCNKI